MFLHSFHSVYSFHPSVHLRRRSPATPPPTTEAQLINNLVQDITLASVTLGEVVNTQPLNQPPPAQPPRTGPGPRRRRPGACRRNSGRGSSCRRRSGETHFIKDEVVLQIPSGITLAQLQAIMGPLGLSILGSQSMGLHRRHQLPGAYRQRRLDRRGDPGAGPLPDRRRRAGQLHLQPGAGPCRRRCPRACARSRSRRPAPTARAMPPNTRSASSV